MLTIRTFVRLIGLSLLVIASAGHSADMRKLPRDHGPVQLGMTVKEFKRATGVDPGAGPCEDCVSNQQVAQLGASSFSKLLDWFPDLAKGEASEAVPADVFFYRGKLEFILFSITGYDMAAVRKQFIRTLGNEFKRETFEKKCVYAAGETLTWSDLDTVITLTEYRDESGNQLDIKLADKVLNREAEIVREFAQHDTLKEIEKDSNCKK